MTRFIASSVKTDVVVEPAGCAGEGRDLPVNLPPPVLGLRTSTNALLFAVGLMLSLVLMVEVGRRVGIRRSKRDAEGPGPDSGAVEGPFGLLGLLIAFTFSGAATRF